MASPAYIVFVCGGEGGGGRGGGAILPNPSSTFSAPLPFCVLFHNLANLGGWESELNTNLINAFIH